MHNDYVITKIPTESPADEVQKICEDNWCIFQEKLAEARKENPERPELAKKCLEAAREILNRKQEKIENAENKRSNIQSTGDERDKIPF